jgi:hypothetical protein
MISESTLLSCLLFLPFLEVYTIQSVCRIWYRVVNCPKHERLIDAIFPESVSLCHISIFEKDLYKVGLLNRFLGAGRQQSILIVTCSHPLPRFMGTQNGQGYFWEEGKWMNYHTTDQSRRKSIHIKELSREKNYFMLTSNTDLYIGYMDADVFRVCRWSPRVPMFTVTNVIGPLEDGDVLTCAVSDDDTLFACVQVLRGMISVAVFDIVPDKTVILGPCSFEYRFSVDFYDVQLRDSMHICVALDKKWLLLLVQHANLRVDGSKVWIRSMEWTVGNEARLHIQHFTLPYYCDYIFLNNRHLLTFGAENVGGVLLL